MEVFLADLGNGSRFLKSRLTWQAQNAPPPPRSQSRPASATNPPFKKRSPVGRPRRRSRNYLAHGDWGDSPLNNLVAFVNQNHKCRVSLLSIVHGVMFMGEPNGLHVLDKQAKAVAVRCRFNPHYFIIHDENLVPLPPPRQPKKP